MELMKTKSVAFRCPVSLMQRVDAVAAALGVTRTALVVEAVRMLIREVRNRDGRLVPPYSGKDALAALKASSEKFAQDSAE